MNLTIASHVDPGELTLRQQAVLFSTIRYCNQDPNCKLLNIAYVDGKVVDVRVTATYVKPNGHRSISTWTVSRKGRPYHRSTVEDQVPC